LNGGAPATSFVSEANEKFAQKLRGGACGPWFFREGGPGDLGKKKRGYIGAGQKKSKKRILDSKGVALNPSREEPGARPASALAGPGVGGTGTAPRRLIVLGRRFTSSGEGTVFSLARGHHAGPTIPASCVSSKVPNAQWEGDLGVCFLGWRPAWLSAQGGQTHGVTPKNVFGQDPSDAKNKAGKRWLGQRIRGGFIRATYSSFFVGARPGPFFSRRPHPPRPSHKTGISRRNTRFLQMPEGRGGCGPTHRLAFRPAAGSGGRRPNGGAGRADPRLFFWGRRSILPFSGARGPWGCGCRDEKPDGGFLFSGTRKSHRRGISEKIRPLARTPGGGGWGPAVWFSERGEGGESGFGQKKKSAERGRP